MLIQKLEQFAIETPDKQAIVYKGKSITYTNLLKEIMKIGFSNDRFRKKM